jgi:hypothetical protein
MGRNEETKGGFEIRCEILHPRFVMDVEAVTSIANSLGLPFDHCFRDVYRFPVRIPCGVSRPVPYDKILGGRGLSVFLPVEWLWDRAFNPDLAQVTDGGIRGDALREKFEREEVHAIPFLAEPIRFDIPFRKILKRLVHVAVNPFSHGKNIASNGSVVERNGCENVVPSTPNLLVGRVENRYFPVWKTS